MSTPLTHPLPAPRIHPVVVSITTTAIVALLLILANKLVGYAGRSAGLKDACWQLTAVRGTLAASAVTGLIWMRKDHLLLLGMLYGISLAVTHSGGAGFSPTGF